LDDAVDINGTDCRIYRWRQIAAVAVCAIARIRHAQATCGATLQHAYAPGARMVTLVDNTASETAKAMDPRYMHLCAKYGHAPLETPGDEGPSNVMIRHTRTGRALFCTRCCAVYWEPLVLDSPPPEKS
jgi:hypothetical protein